MLLGFMNKSFSPVLWTRSIDSLKRSNLTDWFFMDLTSLLVIIWRHKMQIISDFWFVFINHGILRILIIFVLFLLRFFAILELNNSYPHSLSLYWRARISFRNYFMFHRKKENKNPQGWVNNDWFLHFWWNFFQCYTFYALYFPFSSDFFIFSQDLIYQLISISVMEKPKTHIFVFDHANQEKQHCMFISQSAFPLFSFFTVISARLQRLCI